MQVDEGDRLKRARSDESIITLDGNHFEIEELQEESATTSSEMRVDTDVYTFFKENCMEDILLNMPCKLWTFQQTLVKHSNIFR